MRRISPSLKASACALAFGAIFLAEATPADAARKFITLGTADVNGVYYPVGGTICRFLNRKKKELGINCAVESTGGSIDNLMAIRSNDLDIGFAQSDWQANAYNGSGIFADQGPNRDLRSIFSLYSEALTVVAGKSSDIKTIDDLKGKRVNLGSPLSGMRATMSEVMQVKGWNMNVFRMATEFKASEQTKKLCDGSIDAFVFATGHPNGSIQDVTSGCGARIVDVSGPDIAKLLREYSYYAPATIPGGMYDNNPNDVHTFGVRSTLVTSKNVDDELVYQLVKSVFTSLDDFKTTHPILSTLNKEQMISSGLTAPLHDGAKRYYIEAGLLKE